MMMMMNLLPYLLILLCWSHGETKKAAEKKTSISNFKKYLRRMEYADSSLAIINDDTFEKLIVEAEGNRSFHVVILFTATGPQYQCQACRMTVDTMSAAAKSYLIHRSRHPEESVPIVLAVADVDTAQEALGKYMKMSTIPHTFAFPANFNSSLPASPDQEIEYPPDNLQVLLAGIHAKIGVSIKEIPDVHRTVQVATAIALGFALIFFLVLDQWKWIKQLPYNKYLWLSASYFIFASAVGGMVFCIIRSPPPFIYHQQGVQLFATRSSQEQFIAEGVIIGAINLLCSLSFIFAYVFASKSRNFYVQYIGTNIFLAVAFYLLMRLFTLYMTKTHWYRFDSVIHTPVSQYIFGNVKRGSGLIKRFIKITQIWLFEYRDWPTFYKSAKVLLVKWVKRTLSGGPIGGK